MSKFLHGVEVIEAQSGTRPIKTVKSSVIGLIGTAPFADEDAFPLNTPVLIAGKRAEAAKLVNPSNTDFAARLQTLRDAALAVEVTKFKAENNDTAPTADELKALTEKVKKAVTDVEYDRKGTLVPAVDGIFDQAGAVIIVVRVADGDEATVTQRIVGGVAADGSYEGMQAFLGAESVVGVAPRILVAPGYTHQKNGSEKNPVVTDMVAIANRLRAVIIADGPNTNDDDAKAYRKDFGSRRVFVVDPAVRVFRDGQSVVEPASARVAGMIAKSDNDRGFWWSPSNTNMNGIVATARPIDFQLGDSNARANLLNENEVATIIRQNGFKLWGNRTCSDDPKWAFLSVVRTADMINDSLLRAHMWAVDRNITKTYIDDVVQSVQGYLDSLKAQGAILGGEIWADEELNTPINIQAGKVYFSFDFTPPTPAEHITFKSILTNNYLEEIV
ncbi:phage tail sheath subtilisin-like domain-containing protein [Pseudoalteromonas sp. MMG013]|uniref:phage tail sheath subtilisin-like domain-containing protein n=1 Tax=unclassified Pseudoalteromonas TaxID=194690 RepID=UPI001B3776A2|nr:MULTISPECIES: phage tail sheath subtilisin-like domain-containing protein [unclassified Pseudoalteromonas]MBQ4851307.1 phage tail sheath subtilisin-like domain-containing protein [Pseudoalteromonas sp. MMG012]MBQ4862934.1 phage tail sheath subtilisin-like domain-containing protein [Pseudoalteromonas sp. MMG013]